MNFVLIWVKFCRLLYLADIKKLISWYNLLVACGITDFEDTAEAETTEEGKTEE